MPQAEHVIMHRIIKAHLDGFVKSYALEAEDEASQSEKFVNFSVIAAETPSSLEIDDVTTSNADDGIDGVAVIIDEEVIISPEDAKKTFSTPRRNHDVHVVFIQAKRSESFDLGDFLKFKEAILRFASQDPYLSVDETLLNARQMFDVVLEEVPKVRNGKPSLVARFVTTGTYQKPPRA
jgi:hypothetical protein